MTDPTPLEALTHSHLDHLERMVQHPSTGHADLDKLTGGLRPASLFVLTGPAGVGCSMAGLTFARAAAKGGHRTLIVNCEITNTEQMNRLLSAEGRVPLFHISNSTMTEDEWDRLAQVMAATIDLPITMHDRWTTFDGVAAHVANSDNPPRVIVIDGLNQLARAVAPEQRAAAHAELTAAAKRLARVTQATVVATVPTNRKTGVNPAGFLSAAWSASYETDADVVMYLHREDQMDRESPRAGEIDFRVLINRFGPTATATVALQTHYARTVDMAPPA